MGIEISTPWVTLHTANPDHWQTQAITVRYNEIQSLRLVKCLGRAGIDGPDNGIEIICHGKNSLLVRHWMRYEDYAKAEADHRYLLNCLNDIG